MEGSVYFRGVSIQFLFSRGRATVSCLLFPGSGGAELLVRAVQGWVGSSGGHAVHSTTVAVLIQHFESLI